MPGATITNSNPISTCVILAGGLGTRLHAVTGDRIPKALVEVAGRPFLDWQLRLLKSQQIDNVILCIGHHAEAIEQFAGNGSKWGIQINYSKDGPKLLGTGGALRQALDRGLVQESFFLLYGDSYLPVDFQRVANSFLDSKRPALMSVYQNKNTIEPSNCCVMNGEIKAYVKSPAERERLKTKHGWEFDWVDYGLSIFSVRWVERIPSQTVADLAVELQKSSLENELSCYEMASPYFEVGSEAGLKKLDQWLRTN